MAFIFSNRKSQHGGNRASPYKKLNQKSIENTRSRVGSYKNFKRYIRFSQLAVWVCSIPRADIMFFTI